MYVILHDEYFYFRYKIDLDATTLSESLNSYFVTL